MKYNFFKGLAKCPISVCYKYHKPESDQIVVYNNTPHTIKSTEITLKNSSNISFLYKENRLEKKSNCLIDFSHRVDINGMHFAGDLADVNMKCSAGNFKFSPQSGKFLTLI